MRFQAVLRGLVRIACLLLTGMAILSSCQPSLNCQDALGCVVIPGGKPLLIGVEKATTGDEQIMSQAVIDGLKYANKLTPLFESHAVELYFQDAPCNPQERLKTASALSSVPDLPVIFGPFCQAASKSYGKMISDAGITLISPGPITDFSLEPGWFSNYPSLDTLVAAFEHSIPTESNSAYLIVQNQAVDQDFATKFCEILKKNSRECSVILHLEIGESDLSSLSNNSILESGTLFIIMPFSGISRLSGLPKKYQNMNLVFFDPELREFIDSSTLILKNITIVTYSFRNNAENLKANISPDSSEIVAAIAYDSYNMLMQNLTKVARVSSDGSLIIPRQELRNAMANTIRYEGLTGEYTCNSQNTCLDPGQFLHLITTKH
jgi:branched-chain amino acid transport system substrate-binding protein